MAIPHQRIQAREEALLHFIEAVEHEVKQWAAASINGAQVWEMATEDLPNLWFWWNTTVNDEFFEHQDINQALDQLATKTKDSEVLATVETAKREILAYFNNLSSEKRFV
jgi:hypothetical protein